MKHVLPGKILCTPWHFFGFVGEIFLCALGNQRFPMTEVAILRCGRGFFLFAKEFLVIVFLDVHFGERTELAWPEIASEGLKGTLGSFTLDDCIDCLFGGNVLGSCRR